MKILKIFFFFAPALLPGDFPESRNLIHGPRISVSARNDLFPRVQEEKRSWHIALNITCSCSHTHTHTHTLIQRRQTPELSSGHTVVPVIGRNGPRNADAHKPTYRSHPFQTAIKTLFTRTLWEGSPGGDEGNEFLWRQ